MTIDQFNFAGKKAIVRVDFNVPLDENGNITDDTRIRGALPTLKKILADGGALIIMSHMGKPKGKVNPKLSLSQIKDAVAAALNTNVTFAPDCAKAKDLAANLKAGEVLLLENLRFYPEEEGKPVGIDKESPEYEDAKKAMKAQQKEFAKTLASYADCYVMDAFGSAHRAHASTYGIPEILKNEGKQVAAGYLVEKEIANLMRCVDVSDSDRPYVAILGGLKVSDKIKVIDSLLKKCDKILIGGAMAYTFKKALGEETGNSPVEDDQLEYAKKCLLDAKGRIVLPVDCVCADAFQDWTTKLVSKEVPAGYEGMDIGPETQKLFANEIANAKMIFWNGPMGVFEQKDFATGTIAICKAVASLTDCFSVCGGGDSAAAIKEFGYKDAFSHVSTGGGASLEMIENDGHLPGVDILKQL